MSKKMEKVADEFKELTDWKDLMHKLNLDYGDHIEQFFTKENPFFNHHLCEVKEDEVTYKSTEHCLFVQWALHCKDTAAAEEIKSADTAAKAMKRGQKVPFPGGIKPWHQFTNKVLERQIHAESGIASTPIQHVWKAPSRSITRQVLGMWTYNGIIEEQCEAASPRCVTRIQCDGQYSDSFETKSHGR